MRIEGLTPTDDSQWRIDFFGYISYDDEHGRKRSQPLIKVWLSKLNEIHGSELSSQSPEFNSVSLTDHYNQRSASVPVSYLMILRIGQIWRNGILCLSPRYREVSLYEVNIAEQSCYSILAGSPQTDESTHSDNKAIKHTYYIPKSHHPYHSECTKTSCEVVEHRGRKYIFPHTVLIQAYFQLNSWAFTQLFQFGLQLDTLYYPPNTLCTNRKAVIQLRPKVKDISAPTIARIAFDEWAKKAAKKISENLSLQEMKGWTKSAVTTFPFRGKTNLKLRGKFIPENFIVYEILSCSSQYPFDELNFYRDNPGKLEDTTLNSNATPRQKSAYSLPKAFADDNFHLTPNNDPHPNEGYIDIDIDVGFTTTLTSLANIEITKQYNQDPNISDTSLASNVHALNASHGNTGEATMDGSGTKVDKSPAPSDSARDKFVFPLKVDRLFLFREVIERLQTSPDISNLQILPVNTSSNDKSFYSYFPAAYTEFGRQKSWRFIQNDNETLRIRKAITVLFRFKDKSIAISEAERRIKYSKEASGWLEHDDISTLMVISSNPQVNFARLKQLFQSCSDNSGIWQTKDQRSEYQAESKTLILRHPTHETVLDKSYVTAFITHIFSKLNH